MAIFFWDTKGIIYIMEKSKTTTSQYYAELLQCLKNKIKNK